MSKLSKELFLQPILKGQRFDDHAIPVEVLAEFNAYKLLILEVAKFLFKKNNNRARLPSGFVDQLTLKISKIEKGSAIALLEREFDSTAANYNEFTDARELVDSFISNQDATSLSFPPNLIYLFDAFGKSLREDEEFVLCKPNQNAADATTYTKAIRNKILTINRKPAQAAVKLVGQITDVNLNSKKFEIHTESGLVSGQYENQFSELLRDSHRESENTETTIVGIGLITPDNAISRIDKIQHLISIGSENKVSSVPNIEGSLNSMKSLTAGWFDGEQGLPISITLIEFTKKFFEDLFSQSGIVFPYLYPTLDAGIRAEWSWGNWEVSTEFVDNSKNIEILATQSDGEQTREIKINVSSSTALEDFADFLNSLSKVHYG